jgi:hypothetical protein
MREAGQWCTSYADYPLEPHQTSLLTPLGPSTGAPEGGGSRRVLELIINSFYRSFPEELPTGL